MQKILLADDERDVRALLHDELESAEYRVTTVGTGAEAVIAAADGGYDPYLFDMMMPGMNGVQTIQVLRKITPKVPILGLTGYTGQGYMAQASSYNVTCLAKPIDINDFLNEIKIKLADAARHAACGIQEVAVRPDGLKRKPCLTGQRNNQVSVQAAPGRVATSQYRDHASLITARPMGAA